MIGLGRGLQMAASAVDTIAPALVAGGMTRDAVVALSDLKNEPAWMREFRLAAWETYERLPQPNWKRTDISNLNLANLIFYTPSGQLTPLAQQALAGSSEMAGAVVQVDSQVVHVQLLSALLAKGVILVDMDTAVQQYPDLVKKYFMAEIIKPDFGKFEALHAALWSGGTFLYVPRNVEVEMPFYNFLTTTGDDRALFPHTLIVTETGASIHFLEETLSETFTGQTLVGGVTEIYLHPNSRVKFTNLQNWGLNVYNLVTRRTMVHNDAAINYTLAEVGAKLTHQYQEAYLVGTGANTESVGVFYFDHDQHWDMYALMDHVASFTFGDLLLRGALADTSRSIFEGLIKIRKNAQETNSYLHDNTLVMSKHARADSIPSLEIEANEVRASHGATIGQLDEDQVFYLMSRGIDRREAERVILEGFFAPVLQRIPLEQVREKLLGYVDEKMGTVTVS